MDAPVTVQVLTVLKWVGLVFAAGFVGYFGKYLSKLILQRVHKRRPQQLYPPPSSSETKEKDDYKLEKKRLKLEQKKLKKT